MIARKFAVDRDGNPWRGDSTPTTTGTSRTPSTSSTSMATASASAATTRRRRGRSTAGAGVEGRTGSRWRWAGNRAVGKHQPVEDRRLRCQWHLYCWIGRCRHGCVYRRRCCPCWSKGSFHLQVWWLSRRPCLELRLDRALHGWRLGMGCLRAYRLGGRRGSSDGRILRDGLQFRPEMREPGTAEMTITGVRSSKVLTALSLVALGATLLTSGFSTLGDSDLASFLALAQFAGATVALALASRALASRVEFRGDDVRLHFVWCTRVLPARNVARVGHRRWLGWDVLSLELADGGSVRLPLLTQPGPESRLRQQEELLRSYLGRTAGSPTTAP